MSRSNFFSCVCGGVTMQLKLEIFTNAPSTNSTLRNASARAEAVPHLQQTVRYCNWIHRSHIFFSWKCGITVISAGINRHLHLNNSWSPYIFMCMTMNTSNYLEVISFQGRSIYRILRIFIIFKIILENLVISPY